MTTIPSGTRLGPYEVGSPIGAGGMGEVYRGRDTRLDRSVAIKILPATFAQNAQLKLRFEREARTISSLNHPNICTLFDVGHESGTDFLVMELIEGESLADRLSRGPLSPDQVLKLGSQIAEALDRAHKQGIIHRDLKPGNVMLTKSGAKLLDFGLARSGVEQTSDPEYSAATEARPLTQEGTIIGTFQYMAPEQLEGSEADVRSDIFALGALLFEMATGQRAFTGKSRVSLIASIVSSQPPLISSIQSMAPLALDHVVRKCLEKDPDDRWQSAHDVATELRWINESGSQSGVSTPLVPRRKTREKIAWSTAALFAAVAAGAVMLALRERPGETARLAVSPPPGAAIVHRGGTVAISPDGRQIVFVASNASGQSGLFIRPLADSAARLLTGTTGATYPFWSHDSREVAFFADGKLKKVNAAGGEVDILAEASDGRGGAWGSRGVIVFAPGVASPLMRVDEQGGSVKQVTTLDPSRSESSHRFPAFLPDGEHFLYLADHRSGGTPEVFAGSIEGSTRKSIMKTDRAPVYAEPGFLIFAHGDRLAAQRFDMGTLSLTGKMVRLPERSPATLNTFDRVATASRNGTLVVAAPATTKSRLVWLNRRGEIVGAIGLPDGNFNAPRISPDGSRVALSSTLGEEVGDIWVVDLVRGAPTRLTFGPGLNAAPFWSPDSTRIAFQSNRRGTNDIYSISPSGGAPSLLYGSSMGWKRGTDWAADGSVVVMDGIGSTSGYDIWIASADGSGKGQAYLETPATESAATISPDGRWIAYESNESGRAEIFVQSFPRPGTKYQVTTSGGAAPQWSRGRRELLFVLPTGGIVSVEVTGKEILEFSPPSLLFRPPPNLGYHLSRDGEKFLMIVGDDSSAAQSLTVVLNWTASVPK